MPKLVVQGALCKCSFGVAPSALQILPATPVKTMKLPTATIMYSKPMVNILPFGMCSSMANPQVASATAAAMGVLTPMPCVPNIVSPWVPGSPKVKIGKIPALTDMCKLNCLWGGMIEIVNPIQQVGKLK
ncbi:DUF4280 domain-containing protein [Fangia hongkongensis]|uniref:DUF4280 domain-containing protein n=1 Tax=Fangia hongkongensis TaxID=270495 RepID=UPI000363518F|nr:DUF4280 domain-containing protein [Fangia hongkongensis]MBK2125108.1 DUF4280 domain-containing protein [Fangia hongkongensis]